jgi:hypothetical protein
MQTNLASGVAAAAAVTELASCHSNAAAVVPAAAVLAELVQTAFDGSQLAAASSSAGQPFASDQLADSTAVSAGTATRGASLHAGSSSIDMIIRQKLPRLGSLLSNLGQGVLRAMTGLVVPSSSATCSTAQTDLESPRLDASKAAGLSEREVLTQLIEFQQKLPNAGDRLQMLKEHRAWLDQVKDYLMSQHTEAQVCSPH